MEENKEIPKFIFKFPLMPDDDIKRIREDLQKNFGKNIAVMFVDEMEMYQLEEIYTKVF